MPTDARTMATAGIKNNSPCDLIGKNELEQRIYFYIRVLYGFICVKVVENFKIWLSSKVVV
jgi:hypothetical protein